MWRCENCGASIPSGAVCPACSRPIDDALSEIVRKTRRVKLRGGVASRWGWRGAVTGFVVGLVLSLIYGAVVFVRHLDSPRWQETMADVFAGVIIVFVVVGAILVPLLFAAIFVVYGAVIKPIFVALFCSVERFEQEYGSSRP